MPNNSKDITIKGTAYLLFCISLLTVPVNLTFFDIIRLSDIFLITSFIIYSTSMPSIKSINLTMLAMEVSDISHVLKLEQLDRAFRYGIDQRFDQTLTPVAESAIELILRKRTNQEVLLKGRYPPVAK